MFLWMYGLTPVFDINDKKNFMGFSFMSDMVRIWVLGNKGDIWIDFSCLWNASVTIILENEYRGYFVETPYFRSKSKKFSAIESFFFAVIPNHPLICFIRNGLLCLTTKDACSRYCKSIRSLTELDTDRHRRYHYHTCYALIREAQYIGLFDDKLDFIYSKPVT